MSRRMELLEEAYAAVSQYTSLEGYPWRPSITDLMAYDVIIGMHESDYEDVEFMDYIWRKTPDEIMQHIVDSSHLFSLEYGLEQFDEEIREYLVEQEFIVHIDDVSDEEYQANLEGRK